MNNKLYIVGVGPGNIDLITKKALDIIEKSDVLIGGIRNLKTFEKYKKEKIEIENNLCNIIKYINENIGVKKIAVLASGDPYIYGIANYINNSIDTAEIETISGISSIQYLAAKINMKWHDMYFDSVHGRNTDVLSVISNHDKVGLFTDKEPGNVLKTLCKNGYGNILVFAGENLSYDNEKITIGYAENLCKIKFSDLCVFILKKETENKKWKYVTGGIPDYEFIRGNVPMTKEEIRTVAIAKMRLKSDSVICDIGSGTGSVAVECALYSRFGKVYAYERDEEAIGLIEKNSLEFGIHNLEIVKGDIIETFYEKFNCCDRAFIGGSGGNIDFVLGKLSENKNVRVVINSVTIETTYETIESLKKHKYENIECVCVSISKSSKAGNKHIMKALNPVYIISGEKYM